MNTQFWSNVLNVAGEVLAKLMMLVVMIVSFVGFVLLMIHTREQGRERHRRYLENEKENRDEEDKAFHNKRWTKHEADLHLKGYRRELERRAGGSYRSLGHFPSLSKEDIHQRIDFLEAGVFRGREQPRRKRSSLSDEETRTEFERECDRQRKKRVEKVMGKDTLAHAELSHAQYQRIKQIENQWEDKKFKGPPKDWRPGENIS